VGASSARSGHLNRLMWKRSQSIMKVYRLSRLSALLVAAIGDMPVICAAVLAIVSLLSACSRVSFRRYAVTLPFRFTPSANDQTLVGLRELTRRQPRLTLPSTLILRARALVANPGSPAPLDGPQSSCFSAEALDASHCDTRQVLRHIPFGLTSTAIIPQHPHRYRQSNAAPVKISEQGREIGIAGARCKLHRNFESNDRRRPLLPRCIGLEHLHEIGRP
jgi:hypothetical protein